MVLRTDDPTPRGDQFFTVAQLMRLEELMNCWRMASDQHAVLPADYQAELEALVRAGSLETCEIQAEATDLFVRPRTVPAV